MNNAPRKPYLCSNKFWRKIQRKDWLAPKFCSILGCSKLLTSKFLPSKNKTRSVVNFNFTLRKEKDNRARESTYQRTHSLNSYWFRLKTTQASRIYHLALLSWHRLTPISATTMRWVKISCRCYNLSNPKGPSSLRHAWLRSIASTNWIITLSWIMVSTTKTAQIK